MGFLVGSNIFHGFGFAMVKPDGFRPVVIPTRGTAASRQSVGRGIRFARASNLLRLWFSNVQDQVICLCLAQRQHVR